MAARRSFSFYATAAATVMIVLMAVVGWSVLSVLAADDDTAATLELDSDGANTATLVAHAEAEVVRITELVHKQVNW